MAALLSFVFPLNCLSLNSDSIFSIFTPGCTRIIFPCVGNPKVTAISSAVSFSIFPPILNASSLSENVAITLSTALVIILTEFTFTLLSYNALNILPNGVLIIASM
ncbi:hypothetical protein LguiA_005261 [Lonicera macranthoides]